MLPFSKCPICGGEVVEKDVEKLLRGRVKLHPGTPSPGMNVRATQSRPVHGASPIQRALLRSAGTAGVPA